MKKVLVILLSLVMIFTFAACGGDSGSGDGGDAAGETYELRLATHYNTEHAGYAAIEKAVAAIEEQTGGAVKISVYPSSQLGDYTVTYQDLGSGAVDLALIP
jgi:TRAP-type C4-dicarboxylate transport system substrate-binding protein